MKAVKKTNKAVSNFAPLEALEDRKLMAVYWPGFVQMDKVFAQYPWLNGGGNGVAVIDRGIDYMHPRLGANPATNTPSPRVVNVFDWNDNDTDPMPAHPPDGPNALSAHATGVAGVLAMLPYKDTDGKTYQGILQNSKLYNLRTSYSDSQGSITKALQWVVDNHAKYNITAINLTDFVGTSAITPAYDAQLKKLWDAGVFIATPVANNWLGDPETGIPPRTAIGYPGKSPYIFATGGLSADGLGVRTETQRGPALDILAPAVNVHLPYYDPTTGVHQWTPYATGNSWGTPMVVGTAVMIRQIDPTIKPSEIMDIIKAGGVWVADTAANAQASGVAGYMRLDVLGAIKKAYELRDDAADLGAGNDTLATATAIALDGSGRGSLAGQKLLIHDHDYYSFTASADGTYDLTAIEGAQLLDANGNVIATVGAGGALRQDLTAGTYYVHLYDGEKSLAGTYSVGIARHVDQPPPAPAVPGDNGTFNDMKYDAGGNLHFVWFDAADKTLKYAVRDAAKVWGTVTTIDSAPGVGNFVSMALDSQGRAGVAYYDATNADLKFAKLTGGTWQVETVDSTKTVGYYPSVKFDSADRPVIAYYYKTGGDLKVATTSSGVWQTSTVDSSGDVGRYPSLAINPATGAWSIAYEATGAGAFKYTQKNKTGWSTSVVDTNGAGGGFVSLAFDAANLPAFSYYDAKNADLKFARFNGSVWSTRAVAAKNSQGLYTNLFFKGNDPVIYYFNKTANALNAARGGASGVFSVATIMAGGGRENRVAVAADGTETYSYFDPADGDLKVVDLI